MDHGACQGAGDSLDGLDFRDDKLPESINVCGLHAHNHVVRAGKDIGRPDAGDPAQLPGSTVVPQTTRPQGKGSPPAPSHPLMTTLKNDRIVGRTRP